MNLHYLSLNSAISCCRIYLLPRRLKKFGNVPCEQYPGSICALTLRSSFLFFLPYHVCGIWDLSSPAGSWTHAPRLGSSSLNPWTTKEIQDLLLEGPWDSSGQDLNWGGESQVSSWGLNFYLFHWPRLVEPVLQNTMLPLPSEEAWP